MDSPGRLEILSCSRDDAPASANHTLPGHASSAPSLPQKRSRQHPLDSRVRPFGDVPTMGQRAWRSLLALRRPICILGFFVVGVASLVVALIDQDDSSSDDVLIAKTLLSSRSGASAATAVKSFAFGSASADDRSAGSADPLLGEMLTPNKPPLPIAPAGDPPLAAHAASSPVLQPAAATSGSAVNQPTPAIPPAGDPTPATQAAPSPLLQPAAPTLASAVNQPTSAIPPARDPLLATHAAPIGAPPSAAATPGNAAVPLGDDEIVRLIKRGRDFLKEGDFAAARLLFKRAADAGSADAALALGSTYDPAIIKQLGAVSVAPDRDRALRWYETAADRGSADAADRYANLKHAH
jgi:hypothetical protein